MCDELKSKYDACFEEWRKKVSFVDLLSLQAKGDATLHKCEPMHNDYRDCCELFMKGEIEKRRKGNNQNK